MKNIHVDGGALSGKPKSYFGNFTVTRELLRALSLIDSVNKYTIFIQKECTDQACLIPTNIESRILTPKIGWMKLRVSLEELTHPSDVFLALNQSLPLYTKGKKIALCHGLSFLKYPELYPDSFRRMKKEIEDINRRADQIIVSSFRVKQEWKEFVGDTKKLVVVPFGIPHEFLLNKSSKKRVPFLLFVGMSHKIKNIPFLIETVRELRKIKGFERFTLLLVGINKSFKRPPFVNLISRASGIKLSKIYSSASCLVSASLYESFNLPVLEALSQNTPVVATENATIPELRKYVTIASNNPKDFAQAITNVIEQPPAIDQRQLREEFSWNNYARELIGLIR